MQRDRDGYGLAVRLGIAIACIVLLAQPAARGQLRANPAALAAASADLIARLRSDPFTYFRFINRAWTSRVCEAFADVLHPAVVRLHGDAHVEQFAVTKDAWGLDDFDDSARGPAYVDIVRFLGSIDLAARQRGWTRDRDALWDRFFDGYRRGLADPGYQPPEAGLVRYLRQQAPVNRAAFLALGEKQMQPMDDVRLKSLVAGIEGLEQSMRRQRPDLPPGYFAVVRAGWLRIGVGSAAARKVLVRVQGRTADPADDELIEAKEVASLDGLRCLEDSGTPQAVRVIDGARQLGRLKHDILAIGPTLQVPADTDGSDHSLEWWVSSWEPSYREVHLADLRAVEDLADIAFDAGVQLGAAKLVDVPNEALSSLAALDSRLRKETSIIVEELLAGWRELAGR